MSAVQHTRRAQIINLLQKLGWKEYALPQQNRNLSSVILQDVLAKWLHKSNSFAYKNRTYKFSPGSIQAAINTVKNVASSGSGSINEKVYELLTSGRSFTEVVQQDRKAFTLKFIDWLNPAKNLYHLVHNLGSENPDIVLFVNGIPFVALVITKQQQEEADGRITLRMYYQHASRPVPNVLDFAQWLLALQVDKERVYYSAPGTAQWSEWQEDNLERCEKILKSTLHGSTREDRPPNALDSSLVALLERKRFMELVYKFMLYDGADTKIIRHQQFETVQASLRHIRIINPDGSRQGGAIWYKLGNDADLTIIMLAKAIGLEKGDLLPLVLIITDRTALFAVVHKAFLSAGLAITQARSGADLIALLRENGKRNIITSFDKVLAMAKQKQPVDYSTDAFVLIDENQDHALSSVVSKMKSMLPRACYINFAESPAPEEPNAETQTPQHVIHQYALDESPVLVVEEASDNYHRESQQAALSLKGAISQILRTSISKLQIPGPKAMNLLDITAARILTGAERAAIRDWRNSADAESVMENAIEDVLMEYQADAGFVFPFEEVDEILKASMMVLRERL